MKLYFKVEVTIKPRETQSTKEFEAEDGKDMADYLKEKIHESMQGAWQYNAVVISSNIKQLKK